MPSSRAVLARSRPRWRRSAGRSGLGRRAPVAGGQPWTRCPGPPSSHRRRAPRRPPRRSSSRHRGLASVTAGTLVVGSWRWQRQPSVAPTSTSSASTRSGRSRWTPSRRRTPGTPGRRWRSRPLAYVLWQRYLRFDPAGSDLAQPRPLRALRGPRLDAALLAALPDRGEGGRSRLRDRRASPAVSLDDIKRVPAARLQVPRASRVPLDLRGRDDHRPARPGDRDQRRHGGRLALAGRPLQPPRASSSSTSTSTRSPATAA